MKLKRVRILPSIKLAGRVSGELNDLGGHFKTGHTWTAQNRP